MNYNISKLEGFTWGEWGLGAAAAALIHLVKCGVKERQRKVEDRMSTRRRKQSQHTGATLHWLGGGASGDTWSAYDAKARGIGLISAHTSSSAGKGTVAWLGVLLSKRDWSSLAPFWILHKSLSSIHHHNLTHSQSHIVWNISSKRKVWPHLKFSLPLAVNLLAAKLNYRHILIKY